MNDNTATVIVISVLCAASLIAWLAWLWSPPRPVRPTVHSRVQPVRDLWRSEDTTVRTEGDFKEDAPPAPDETQKMPTTAPEGFGIPERRP